MSFSNLSAQPLAFSVTGLELSCSFRTETSISFVIGGTYGKGWIDVHYPCAGHLKVQIRGALPEHVLDRSKVLALIHELLDHLKIPRDETFDALFFEPVGIIGIQQTTNREGMTDRIQTSRSYKPPSSKG